jgi:hypothetical protein
MERIRKRLGECVPVEALFPEKDEREDDEYSKESIDISESGHRSHFAANCTSLAAVYEYPDEHGDEGLSPGFDNAATSRSKSWGKGFCRVMRLVTL